MNIINYFAGWPSCTPEQVTQKSLAQMVGTGLFAVLSVVMYYAFRSLIKSKHGKVLKIALGIVLRILTIPICVGVPLVIAFVMTPWCT